MSDGLNDARAMRIAEVMNDYTAIQTQLAGLQSTLQSMQQGLPGSVILRQCLVGGRSLLAKPVPGGVANPPSPGEETKTKLQAILLDAAARRFLSWRLYKRAMAATQWWAKRNQALQGKPPTAANQKVLSQIDDQLRQDILAVTDQKAFSELNQKDVAAGNWTAEMPNLARVLQYSQVNLG